MEDAPHLITKYTLTFGLSLNPQPAFGVSCGEPVLLYENLSSEESGLGFMVRRSVFIYRLKLEPKEEAAKMSASVLAVSKPGLMLSCVL